MNREIKFRAFNKTTDKMIDLQKITPFALDSELPDKRGLFIPFHDDLELMQFSGCVDKNDKDIYEGDILKITDHGDCEWVDDVIFKSGAFQIEVQNQDYDITAVGWIDDYAECEVIGNIYENPELLTEG